MSLKKNEITIGYKLPDPIIFEINEGTSGSLNFRANRPGFTRYQKAIAINQRVEFEAVTTTEKKLEDLLEYTNIFQNFLTLALYRSTYPLSIYLKGERHKEVYGNGKRSSKKIKLFFSSRNFKPDEKPKIDIEIIFDYLAIRNEFPAIIKTWFAKEELLKPAFDLVFEQFYKGNEFTTNSFLNLAQSAETFHARVHNHTRMPKAEFQLMKEAILKIAPSEYHDWLNDQFNFGNNLNLHARLCELTEKYSNSVLETILGNKEQFVTNIKVSRNYYTHYAKNEKKKALKDEELYFLSERLKVLLVCAFLEESGFEKRLLESCLENVKWKLFNHLADWRAESAEA